MSNPAPQNESGPLAIALNVPNSKTSVLISNGNRTEWSPIQSVIIRVITKSDDRAAESDLFITSMITD